MDVWIKTFYYANNLFNRHKYFILKQLSKLTSAEYLT